MGKAVIRWVVLSTVLGGPSASLRSKAPLASRSTTLRRTISGETRLVERFFPKQGGCGCLRGYAVPPGETLCPAIGAIGRAV